MDLRIRGAERVLAWVRFDEAANTFSMVDPVTGTAGPGRAPRSDGELASAAATVLLSESFWIEPADAHVDVTWTFGFAADVAGQVYLVDTAATDDFGNVQDFETIGTVAVGVVCDGDCGGDGKITVDELVNGINIILGTKSPEACLSLDAGRNGAVEINELVGAVTRALHGCPGT